MEYKFDLCVGITSVRDQFSYCSSKDGIGARFPIFQRFFHASPSVRAVVLGNGVVLETLRVLENWKEHEHQRREEERRQLHDASDLHRRLNFPSTTRYARRIRN